MFLNSMLDLKKLLHQGLSEPEFYGDLVYKFKQIVGSADFSDQFRKNILCYKRIGYNINIMRQSVCLEVNTITVNNFASLFNCTPVGRASGPNIQMFIFVGWSRSIFCLLLDPPALDGWFSFTAVSQWCCSTPKGSSGVGHNSLFLSKSHLYSIIVFICDLFVSRDDPLMS